MKDKLKKQLEQLKKGSRIDALLERGDIEEQALLNSSEDLRPADEFHTFELLETSKRELSHASSNAKAISRPSKASKPARHAKPKKPAKPKRPAKKSKPHKKPKPRQKAKAKAKKRR